LVFKWNLVGSKINENIITNYTSMSNSKCLVSQSSPPGLTGQHFPKSHTSMYPFAVNLENTIQNGPKKL
jgi:hypothetical protein